MAAVPGTLPLEPSSKPSLLEKWGWRAVKAVRFARFRLLEAWRPAKVRSAYGITLTSNWGDQTFFYYVTGTYGRFLAQFLSQQTEPFRFLDIGANQGLYSILADRNPHCRAVYAFEPVGPIADLLQDNLRTNRTSVVTVVRHAISDRNATLDIAFNAGHSGSSSLADHMPAGGDRVSITTIDHTALSGIVAAGTEPIIVKVDVEGHEPVVIAELLKTDFAPAIRAIFYECDDDWTSEPHLRRLLQDHGFERFRKIGLGSHYDVLATRPDGTLG